MPTYVRKWDCACCGGHVIYNSETGELTCLCATIKLAAEPNDLHEDFVELPKNLKVVQHGVKQS